MITTIDNPFNPKENYLAWNAWDIENGYNTSSMLARILQNFIKIDEEYSSKDISEAQQIMLDMDMIGIYKII